MKSLKTKNGITLIALVITIIVLLILAGVSISTITGENGIVSKAKEAKEKTESAAKEETGKLDEYDKYIDSFVTSSDGEIDETLKRYILGEDGNGIDANSIINYSNNIITFIDNAIIPEASTDIICIGMDCDDIYIYLDITYNDEVYRIHIGNSNKKTLKLEKYNLREIYSGNRGLTEEELQETNLMISLNLKELLLPWKKYMFDFTINGEKVSATSGTDFFMISTTPAVSVSLDYGQTILLEDGSFFLGSSIFFLNKSFFTNNAVVINNIYEIGKATDCVQENGNIMMFSDRDGWCLTGLSGSGEKIVPSKIDGRDVYSMRIDSGISGKITITQPINFVQSCDVIYITEIKITTTNLDFLGEAVENDFAFPCISLDLSECGDDMAIPEKVLDGYQNYTGGLELGKIYVTEAVKENYLDYDFVVVR